jgi:hypothetical protein
MHKPTRQTDSKDFLSMHYHTNHLFTSRASPQPASSVRLTKLNHAEFFPARTPFVGPKTAPLTPSRARTPRGKGMEIEIVPRILIHG